MKQLITGILLLISLQSSAQWAGAVLDSLTHNHERDEIGQQCFDIYAENSLHIIYKRANPTFGWNLYHKHFDAVNGWSAEDTVTERIAYDPSLSVSGVDEEVFVAYETNDSSSQEIYISSNAGGTWNSIRLTSDSVDDFTPSIDVDANGFAHAAWTTTDPSGDFKIAYSTNMSGSWVTQILTATQLGMFGSGAIPCIASDKSGIANITYRGEVSGNYRIIHIYNDSPGGTSWTMHSIVTQNGEDLSSTIEIDDDTTAHIFVTGDDGFGFPVKAFYVTKPFSSPSYSAAIAVAPSFSAQMGDMFVDQDNVAHFVLNEVSGNIYTGNVVYADTTDFNGFLLLSTTDIYSANLVIDQQGHAYLAAFQGISFPDEEIIIYGYSNNTGVKKITDLNSPFKIHTTDEAVNVILLNDFTGMISCTSVDGKKLFSETRKFAQGEKLNINSTKGILIFSAENSDQRFVSKIGVK